MECSKLTIESESLKSCYLFRHSLHSIPVRSIGQVVTLAVNWPMMVTLMISASMDDDSWWFSVDQVEPKKGMG